MRSKAPFTKRKAKSKRQPAKSRTILTCRPKATPKKTPAKLRKRSDRSKKYSRSKVGGLCPEHVHAFGTTDVPPFLRSSNRPETADVSLAVRVLYGGGATHISLRTDHFSARPRSAKPVSNQRRICAQKTY